MTLVVEIAAGIVLGGVLLWALRWLASIPLIVIMSYLARNSKRR
ncbi:MAG TPA: hypothetical protein VFB58_01915 [Chloroflexota bacterium]|nr:hypothetical protein [Chloroflexota bacterium]